MVKLLIVVDMQNDFVLGSLGSKDAQKIIPSVENAVNYYMEQENGCVLYTLDTHQENYLNTKEGKDLPVKHCIENTWGHKLIDELDLIDQKYDGKSFEFCKNTYGSYNLVDFIKNHFDEKVIQSIELCGLCTDVCVISNALMLRSAFPEISIDIMRWNCAGTTKEKHNAALEVMKSCGIDVYEK